VVQLDDVPLTQVSNFTVCRKTAIIMLKLLGTTTQNFAAGVNRCPEFVHPCKCALYIENGF